MSILSRFLDDPLPPPRTLQTVSAERPKWGLSVVATATEWRERFAPEDFPDVGMHQRAGESCIHCGGFWPCEPARGQQ